MGNGRECESTIRRREHAHKCAAGTEPRPTRSASVGFLLPVPASAEAAPPPPGQSEGTREQQQPATQSLNPVDGALIPAPLAASTSAPTSLRVGPPTALMRSVTAPGLYVPPRCFMPLLRTRCVPRPQLRHLAAHGKRRGQVSSAAALRAHVRAHPLRRLAGDATDSEEDDEDDAATRLLHAPSAPAARSLAGSLPPTRRASYADAFEVPVAAAAAAPAAPPPQRHCVHCARTRSHVDQRGRLTAVLYGAVAGLVAGAGAALFVVSRRSTSTGR